MKVLVCNLIYGDRPYDILIENEAKAGYPATFCTIDTEGIANALNEGIAFMQENGFDAIAFLANDIIEPDNWLLKKVTAMHNYPDAGIVASSIHQNETEILNQLIISNWLIHKKVIDAVGMFHDSMFPYGPIDLDYCERTWLAGFKTYYVTDCLAIHKGSHATGNEYGWDKQALLDKYSSMYIDNIRGYKDGSISIKR